MLFALWGCEEEEPAPAVDGGRADAAAIDAPFDASAWFDAREVGSLEGGAMDGAPDGGDGPTASDGQDPVDTADAPADRGGGDGSSPDASPDASGDAAPMIGRAVGCVAPHTVWSGPETLVDVFPIPGGLLVVRSDRVALLDRQGRESKGLASARPITAAAFDGTLLAVADAAVLNVYDTTLDPRGSILLSESCAVATLVNAERFVCDPGNNTDRFIYTYDLVQLAEIGRAPVFTTPGFPLRRVPGRDHFVTVSKGVAPSDYLLFRVEPVGLARYLAETPYHGDFPINTTFAFMGRPATHLVTHEGLLLSIFGETCPASGSVPFGARCLFKDGALGTLWPGEKFVALASGEQDDRLYAVVGTGSTVTYPIEAACQGDCLVQSIDPQRRLVLGQRARSLDIGVGGRRPPRPQLPDAGSRLPGRRPDRRLRHRATGARGPMTRSALPRIAAAVMMLAAACRSGSASPDARNTDAAPASDGLATSPDAPDGATGNGTDHVSGDQGPPTDAQPSPPDAPADSGPTLSVELPVDGVPADGFSWIPILVRGNVPADAEVELSLSRMGAGLLRPRVFTLGPDPQGFFTPCSAASAGCLGPVRIRAALRSQPDHILGESAEIQVRAEDSVGSAAACLLGGPTMLFDGNGFLFRGFMLLREGRFTEETSDRRQVTLLVEPRDPTQGRDWRLVFASTNLMEDLKVGVYRNAERAAFAGAGRPGLDISGNSSGCNMVQGAFQVHRIVWASDRLQDIVISFEHRCDLAERQLRGCIRFVASP